VVSEGPPFSLALLRRGLSARGDPKTVPLSLEIGLASAAYTGSPLPYQVLGKVLERCTADRGATRERVALIKAFLIRNERRNVTVALDPDEPDPAYRLGRLFAVLEWIQLRAINGRVSIAEQYWGSASTTPAYVFPELLKLAVFHLAKLDGLSPPWPGFATNRRKDIDAIMEGLPSALPRYLELIDQGSFAVGYWHQSALRRHVAEASPAGDTMENQAA
jgi:CRISPR-associated protein Csd1